MVIFFEVFQLFLFLLILAAVTLLELPLILLGLLVRAAAAIWNWGDE